MASNQQILDHSRAMADFNRRLLAAIVGVSKDVTTLKKAVEDIQNSTGRLSPEDQASLDEGQAAAKSATEQLEALDALTRDVPAPLPVDPSAPQPA